MRASVLLVAFALTGCGVRQVGGEEGAEDMVERDWSPCVSVGEFETCEQVCQAQGMACAADSCPASPMFCMPDSCEVATSVVGIGEGICADPTVGGYYAHACDEAIPFILNNTARCCCEG